MSAALLIDSRPHSVTRTNVAVGQPYRPGAPITSSSVRSVSLTLADYVVAVATGHRVVDIRTQDHRDAHGIVAGALAIDSSVLLDRLVPGGPGALRAATPDSDWILLSSDGHDAEWLAWHLQARGVVGTRFLIGGVEALHADVARPDARLSLSLQGHRDLATIAAH